MLIIEQREKLLRFIRSHTLAILSTVSLANKPEAAAIDFSCTANLEIIFDTFTTYRKYHNLQHNPHVALVIGWENSITVQYEGIALELKDQELLQYQKIHWEQVPHTKKFIGRSEVRYFKVSPTWIRYSDLSVNPWNIFELQF